MRRGSLFEGRRLGATATSLAADVPPIDTPPGVDIRLVAALVTLAVRETKDEL